MKEGNGEHSYYTNSHYQRSVFSGIEHVVIESFIEMLMNLDYPDPNTSKWLTWVVLLEETCCLPCPRLSTR
ncbi:unnamed protein product [Brassica rapa subsp. trilocularis]